jgi:hypothetical protein
MEIMQYEGTDFLFVVRFKKFINDENENILNSSDKMTNDREFRELTA